MCRFDPNEQFRISQISLSRDSRQLIVAISQAARLSKQQPKSHLRLEQFPGGGHAKGHSLTLGTHGLGYAPRLEPNTSLTKRSSGDIYAAAHMRREVGSHPDVSRAMGCLSVIEILFFNIMRISFALHPDQSQRKSMTKITQYTTLCIHDVRMAFLAY